MKVVSLHSLMRHLSECPPELYNFPEGGPVVPLAVLQDTVFHLGGSELSSSRREELHKLQSKKTGNRQMSFLLLGCYVLNHSLFMNPKQTAVPNQIGNPKQATNPKQIIEPLLDFLFHGLPPLAGVATASDFVRSTDRREEFIRLILNELRWYPEGETEKMASSRLESLDTVRRVNLMKKAAALRQRQEELRRAMEKKAAEEAASKWSRE